jgi:hypothetical protein
MDRMLEQPVVTRTIVSFLLDRTGSMATIKDETISGFNVYLDALEREAGDLVAFTLLQFDSQSIDTLYAGSKLSEVQRLTPETYQPRAYTPLIDACFATIKATEEIVAQRRDKPRIIVVFQTDGDENASRKHTVDELRDLIERRKAEGWQFLFLGADIDAYAVARGFGILEEATVAYRGKRTAITLRETASAFADFAQGRARRVRFTAAQKRATGDRYAGANQDGNLSRIDDAPFGGDPGAAK